METNGFLDATNTIHCLVITDVRSNITTRYRHAHLLSPVPALPLEEGVRRLETTTVRKGFIAAHNGIKFDIPAIAKLYPWFTPLKSQVIDTLVLSRLIFADLGDADEKLMKQGKLPGSFFKKHSLAAWGYRLGNPKAEYTGGFEAWSPEMEDYCVQDVSTLVSLLKLLVSKKYSPRAIELEHKVAWIVARQERYGFLFDKARAATLYANLVDAKLKLETGLLSVFKPRFMREVKGDTVSKKDRKATTQSDNGEYITQFTSEVPYTKVKLIAFNPGSRVHCARWLSLDHGWVPTEFTPEGAAKVDETVLAPLKYPEAKLLGSYFTVAKRLGQVAEGDEAWLRHVKADGRIYGSVITNGAVTGRMTHSKPNMAQVPASHSLYGKDCRECFTVPPGKLLVGADAAALELRCLAGYMAFYDLGAYIKTVTEGKKEDGTEIHTVNRKALQIESRDDAKTWFYAFIYGSGDENLGCILGAPKGLKARARGKASKANFMRNLPALAKLVDAIKKKAKAVGSITGLDGRTLQIRSPHSAPNTLLQSAGAVLMKQALVFLDERLQDMGYLPGTNYEFVANVHDEWQIECDVALADIIGREAVLAMEAAGRAFNFACPITGEYRAGNNWAETH